MKMPFRLPHKAEERNRIVGLIAGFLVALIAGILSMTGVIHNARNFDLDVKFKMRQDLKRKIPTNKDIILVEIDDLTMEREGTFPDDPSYYTDLITMLGRDQIDARAVLFSIDYSRPYGRKVDSSFSDVFTQQLGQVTSFLEYDLEIKKMLLGQIGEMNSQIDPSSAPLIGQTLGDIVYSPELTQTHMNLEQVASFANYVADLDVLAPDREKAVSAAAAAARNVYFTHEAENREITHISPEDLKKNIDKRKIFEALMRSPTKNRPERPREADVFDAYLNLMPQDYDYLISSTDGKFPNDVTDRLREELRIKKAEVQEYHLQNDKISFPIPKGLKGHFVQLREVRNVTPQIGRAISGSGIYKAEFAPGEGTLRRIAPIVEYDGRLYPHSDLLMAMVYLGVKPGDVEIRKNRILLKNARKPGAKKKQTIEIPLTGDACMIVNWAGEWADTTTFAHNAFINVVSDLLNYSLYETARGFNEMTDEQKTAAFDAMSEADQRYIQDAIAQAQNIKDPENLRKTAEAFRGKIIIVGRTAVGMAETNPTPIEPRFHIMGLHPNVINTITNNLFIHQIPGWAVALLYIALGVMIGFVSGSIHTKSSVLTGAVNFVVLVFVVGAYWLANFILFFEYDIELPLTIPIGILVLVFLFVFIYRFFTEEAEKKKMKGMFSTYVNKEVVDSLMENPDKVKLGGEWMNCTVFFSDVAGFTSISESMSPEDLVKLLNEYLTAMTDIVFKYGGTLDKYIGDAIVAFYGAPVPFEDHAAKACLATIEMQEKLAELRTGWAERGKPEITARCGLNSGPIIVGNMGSTLRLNYTVVGENVEFGEHLESSGKAYGTMMTISQPTRDMAGDAIVARWIDIDRITDQSEPIKIFQLIGRAEDPLSDEYKKGIEVFEQGMKCYFERKWDEAIDKFTETMTIHIPGDPTSKKALERAQKMKADPPGPEFDELAAYM